METCAASRSSCHHGHLSLQRGTFALSCLAPSTWTPNSVKSLQVRVLLSTAENTAQCIADCTSCCSHERGVIWWHHQFEIPPQMFALPVSRWTWAESRTHPCPCRKLSPAPHQSTVRCRRRARPPRPSPGLSTHRRGAWSPRHLTAATTAAWPAHSIPSTTEWVKAPPLPTPHDVIESCRWLSSR